MFYNRPETPQPPPCVSGIVTEIAEAKRWPNHILKRTKILKKKRKLLERIKVVKRSQDELFENWGKAENVLIFRNGESDDEAADFVRGRARCELVQCAIKNPCVPLRTQASVSVHHGLPKRT